jgi:hypothetical protein
MPSPDERTRDRVGDRVCPTGALLAVPLTSIAKLILEMASGLTRRSALLVEELPAEPDAEAPLMAADTSAPAAMSTLQSVDGGAERAGDVA